MANNGISAIVCCYNSATRLPKTLEHLAKQVVPDEIPWEVIIVNNKSTDDTTTTALAELAKYERLKQRYQLVNEPRPGLSFARDTGIKNANYDFIVFCDDDNWFEANYINTAHELLAQNPNYGAIGGKSVAVANVAFPEWWNDYKDKYAVGNQAPENSNVTDRMYLWGSGLACRKKLYQQAFSNYPSLLTGRKGNELTAGEDAEICIRFVLMGYELFYTDQLKLRHFIDEFRLQIAYRDKLYSGLNQPMFILSCYNALHQIKKSNFARRFTLSTAYLMRMVLNLARLRTPITADWDASHFYLLTGIKLGKLPLAPVQIKSFANQYV